MSGSKFGSMLLLLMWAVSVIACGGGGTDPLVCAPGTSSCVEGVPSTCNAAGTASVAQAPCEGNEICSDGACVVEVIDEDVVDGDVPILDTFQAECVEDDDCNKTLTLDTCERASCNEGVCEALLKEDGTECADGLCVEGECLEITCPAGEVLCGDDADLEGLDDSVVECNEWGTGLVGEPIHCNDGSVCNGVEGCEEGACYENEDLECDDGDPCTNDSCDPVTGCNSESFEGPCEDGNLCTQDDTCVEGICISGGPVDCFDGNNCTSDSCDMFNGCVYGITNESGSCDDGLPCTGGDTCVLGTCTSLWDTDCDDGNQCTIDSCDEIEGCLHAAVEDGGACDDGSVCTGEESCAAGICQVTEGTTLDCDDANECTTDLCDSLAGCQNINDDESICEDGVACTDGDYCSGGACVSGTPILSDACGTPTNALCGVVGGEGVFATCDIVMARAEETGPAAVALQFSLEYDATALELVQFQDTFCFGIGDEENCQVFPIPSDDSNEIAKGHIIGIAPLLIDDWEGQGSVLLYKFSSSASLSDAWMQGSEVMGDAYIMQVLLKSKTEVPVETPSYLLMSEISASDSSANGLTSTVQQGVLIVE